jgi:hypothetical protein
LPISPCHCQPAVADFAVPLIAEVGRLPARPMGC